MSCEGIPVVDIVDDDVVCPYCKQSMEGAESFDAFNLPMTCIYCNKKFKPQKSQ